MKIASNEKLLRVASQKIDFFLEEKENLDQKFLFLLQIYINLSTIIFSLL